MTEKRISRWYFGGIASCGAACCTHPLDLLKVHLQTQQEVKMRMMGMAMHVVKQDGVLALYNGLSASLCRQMSYSLTRFAIYETVRDMMGSQGPMPFYQKVLLGAFGVGYSLSLTALVLALGILGAFRKLHCMRNNIHMNLFGSFILRATAILVKDALLDLINITQSGRYHNQDEGLVDIKVTVGCRVAMIMMQYSVMANNYWLLVEGLYLHSLLAITIFSERNYFSVYLCIGWGAPVIFVLPWVLLKYLYENDLCWEKNVNMGYWWIIRSPILFAYLINFFIFIRIIKILMSKLKAHQMRYTDYKFRLAKSTLTLIPLLGIHAVLFTFVIDESVDRESLLRLVRLFYDLFFSSFQGLLVAVLYCFVNKEVQNEMLKRWKRWKLGKDIEEEYRNTHSQTAHGKSASINVALPPEHSDTPESATMAPPSEESHCLVKCSRNGAGLAQGVIRAGLPEGTSNRSSLTEDICLEERLQNKGHPLGTEESDI
ncbi:Glucagon receptor [Bagarius yarrelli]|uniref:Glucagon receptor n=1 Tax=Bagarius yarrelli TaxID=175774 RepID=A0A556TL80_BAGYA|nr:Glucagon receptor [Bagarius yarrelli]